MLMARISDVTERLVAAVTCKSKTYFYVLNPLRYNEDRARMLLHGCCREKARFILCTPKPQYLSVLGNQETRKKPLGYD
jgi:hypothetical protein